MTLGHDYDTRPFQWATIFVHDETDEESYKALEAVYLWTQDADIELHVKAINNRNIKEYALEPGPLGVPPVTLRWFNYETGEARREFKGLKEILEFVTP